MAAPMQTRTRGAELTALVKPDPAVTGSLPLTMTLTTGTVTQTPVIIPITLDPGPPPATEVKSVFAFTLNDTAVTSEIREPVIVVMGLRFTPASTTATVVNITCPVVGGLSQCIINKCQVISSGKNIACFNATLINESNPPTYTSTPGNSQQSSCEFDIGSIFDIGAISNDTEDEILFEIEVQPTDHPSNVQDGQFEVTLTGPTSQFVNGSIGTVLQIDRVTADAEKAVHNFSLSTTMTATMDDGDNFLFGDEWNVTVSAKFVMSKMQKIGFGMANLNVTIPCRLNCESFHAADPGLKLSAANFDVIDGTPEETYVRHPELSLLITPPRLVQHEEVTFLVAATDAQTL
ncbi:hypothetical protein GQR58_007497 [Nymphon striatum]|nr:hypothetical protein GQR58_007497 [Nymphon striatum]